MNRIREYLVRFFRQTDKLLLLLALLLSSISVLLLIGIYQASYVRLRVVQVQVIATVLGLIGAFIIAQFGYERLAGLWKLYVPLILGLNIFTAFFGELREGTSNRSWLNFGITTVQPSEFLKVAFILSFAYHLSVVKDRMNYPKTLLALFAHGGVAVGTILLQGDTGVAVIMLLIFLVMIFMGGLSWKIIAAGVAAVAVAVPVGWNFILRDYQKVRFLVLIHPEEYALDEAMQQLEGLLSMGSGQVFGIGLFSTDHNYVPEMYNDFIFTFLGESFGFAGCVLVLLIYAAMLIKILHTAIRCQDELGRLISIGVFAMLFAQITVNISMCLMLMPVIGVTLPLLSYGGSSVLGTYAAIGLALGVYKDNNKNMFSE